ncbi:MAG TPA: hypothetical protein VHS59_00985, partial [Bacillota bacterium]|nr:hypothetical protein [Bacillota bacterium]
NRVSTSKLDIDGHDLKEMGIPSGPVYKEILDAVFKAKLDNESLDRKAQLKLAAKLRKRLGNSSGAVKEREVFGK